MLTEPALKPVCIPHLRGRGHKNSKIAGPAFYSYALTCILKRQITYSHCPAAKQRRNDVILTSVGHDDVAVGRHFKGMCQKCGCQALNHKKYQTYRYFFKRKPTALYKKIALIPHFIC